MWIDQASVDELKCLLGKPRVQAAAKMMNSAIGKESFSPGNINFVIANLTCLAGSPKKALAWAKAHDNDDWMFPIQFQEKVFSTVSLGFSGYSYAGRKSYSGVSGVRGNSVNYSDSEKIASDAILKVLEAIRYMNGKKLIANETELVQSIHVLQSFVKQHVMHRLMPQNYSNWWQD